MERGPTTPRQLARLTEELAEIGLDWSGRESWHALAIEALDYARRPEVFERRVPTFGAIVAPTTDPATWSMGSGLDIELRPIEGPWLKAARLFADGISSWIVLDPAGGHTGAVFDRPAGSERDLVILAEVLGATIVQRHPGGTVRIVGPAGVHRWDEMSWHHEPPLALWIDAMVASCTRVDRGPIVELLLEFALHDLGPNHIGATLVYGADESRADRLEARLPTPLPLRIDHPRDLGPLRHALAQVDGATLFDLDGVMRQIGVRLVPSVAAESGVDGFRGMRHTAARRYSHDEPGALVIVVSESGTVTVLRAGTILGVSPTASPPEG